jgi:hypothetical protein
MAVLGVALAVLGEPPGYANLLLRYGLMGAFMVAPMVGWMRYRGHSWSDGGEMTAAMLVPMFALVVPVELGVSVPGLSEESLMMLSHVAMIAGMVAWMIYRFERYATGSAVTARSASAKTSSEVRRGRIPENGQLAREAQEGISTPGSTFRWMPHYLDLQYHRRQPLT